MPGAEPIVSVGLPVYNGERYVAQAIESILAQSLADWELIISDNGSGDRTPEICRAYAAADPRIRFVRSEENRGVAWNFNRVFELARGRYFKWTAHDDLNAPSQLAQAVALLEARPDLLLVGFQSAVIDDEGQWITVDGLTSAEMQGVPQWRDDARVRETASDRPWTRLHGLLLHSLRCYETFGVIRSDVLRKTQTHGSYRGSDKVLLAELAIRGKFHEIPDVLFFNRWHDGRYSARSSASQQRLQFQPKARGVAVPFQIRCAWHYLATVFRPPLSLVARLMCLFVFLRFLLQVRKWPRIVARFFTGRGDDVSLPPEIRRQGRHPNMPPAVLALAAADPILQDVVSVLAGG